MAGSPIMKLGIVGSGPSGFYVASRLLSSPALASNPNVRVHMFDRLWAPHGLVRYGVAPDHPEVKVKYENNLFSSIKCSYIVELHPQI
jgi:NADPH-dependent glutamate synthase beta subunit-like oxidoreductase